VSFDFDKSTFDSYAYLSIVEDHMSFVVVDIPVVIEEPICDLLNHTILNVVIFVG